MIDPKLLRAGDLLIGFSQYGPVSVVSNMPGKWGGRDLVIAYCNGTQGEVNVRGFGEHVRVLRSSW